MRDDLALHVFNTKNLVILSENEEFCGFAFLLPFTLVTVAILSTNLSTESRYILIRLSFNIIMLLRQNSCNLRTRTSKKNPNVNVKFAQEIMRKRMLNTLIALGYAMKFYKENLKISMIFTHSVEYIFGYMRRLTYGNDKSSNAINSLAEQQISKEIIKKFNLESIYIRGRVANDDDIQNDDLSECELNFNDILFDEIPNEIFELMNGNLNYCKTETAKLINFIHN